MGVTLTHSYAGPGYPAHPFEVGDGFAYGEEPERIFGAFRVVEDRGGHLVIGNGEQPENFWKVDGEKWDALAEEHTPDPPPFVEAISNPIIRAGLRRQVADMRVVARRCGEGKALNQKESQ